MDKELSEDILRLLDRFDPDDEEVESIRSRLGMVEIKIAPPPPDYVIETMATAKLGLPLDRYKDLIANVWAWVKIANVCIEKGDKQTANWIFDNRDGVRKECLTKVCKDQDHKNFQWMQTANMHNLVTSLCFESDDPEPIKFLIANWNKPTNSNSQYPFNPHCLNNQMGCAIIRGHTKIMMYFLENFPEYVTLKDAVCNCLCRYQILTLTALWEAYPETKRMTQEEISSVMDFNTFGSVEWIKMIEFLKKERFDVSSLRTNFTATHHHHEKTIKRVGHLLQ